MEGDWDAELNYVKELVILQPYEPSWHFKLGWHYGTHKRIYDRSIAEYNKAIDTDPNKDPRYYLYLGYNYLNAGRPQEAITALRQYVSLLPEEAVSHDRLAGAYVLVGNYDEAQRELDSALSLKPDFSASLISLGDLAFAQGRYEDALRSYTDYLTKAFGRNEEELAHTYIARLQWQSGNLETALEHIRKVLDSDPNVILANWILDQAYLQRNDVKSAKSTAQKMNEILSTYNTLYQREYVHHLNGKILLWENKHSLAVSEFEKALALGPEDHPFFQNAMAEAHLQNGNFDKAIEACNKVFDFNPNYSYSHYTLAQTYERLKDYSEAAKEYEKCLAILRNADADMPLLKAVREALARIRSLSS